MNEWIHRWMGRGFAYSAGLLRVSLYVMVSYYVLVMALPLHDLLWGEHSLIAPMSFPSLWTNDIIMLLHNESFADLYPLFMVMPFIGMLLVWRRWTRIGGLLVFLGVSILFNRTYTFLVGGNYLLHTLLFYLIFIDERNSGSGFRYTCSNILSHFGLWACRIQLLMVYVFTGCYKLAGASWRNGEAVELILHIDEFTLPWIEHSVAEIHWLMVLANYIALVYFFAFPVLVWNKRWKLPLLIFGVLFHLGLGVAVGVMDFSLVMIASYASFIDKQTVDRLKAMFTKRRAVAHSS